MSSIAGDVRAALELFENLRPDRDRVLGGYIGDCPVHLPHKVVPLWLTPDGRITGCAEGCEPAAILEEAEQRRLLLGSPHGEVASTDYDPQRGPPGPEPPLLNGENPRPKREPGEDDGDSRPAIDPKKVPVPLDVGVAEFFRSCDEEVQYLFAPYIPARGLVLLQGAPKAGKTWFAAYLAAEVARNHRVVFVEEESAKEVLRDRLKPFLGSNPEEFDDRLRVIFKKRIRLDVERTLRELIKASQGAQLIVLDPFVRLHSKREKEQDEMALVARTLQRIMDETGAAVVLVHHTRKGDSWNKNSNADASAEDARGSGVIAGEVDNIISVRGVPQAQRVVGQVRLIVENPASRMGAEFEKRTAVIDLSGGAQPLTWIESEPEGSKETAEDLLQRMVAVLHHAPAATDRHSIRDALRVSLKRLREAIRLGVTRGVLVELPRGVALANPNSNP